VRALQGIWGETIEEMRLHAFLETVSGGADVTFCGGRVFHSLKAATGKARSPTVERRVHRTTLDYDEVTGMRYQKLKARVDYV